MGQWANKLREAAAFAAEAAAETLWPTRCSLCDAPGAVLCERCAASLPYLDWWRACSRCGSPFGFVQCDLCSAVSLERIGREELPFAACAGATVFSAETGRVVRVFKDQGEQRLAAVMAEIMVRTVPPDWPIDAVTFVPATLAAVRHRGYDHAELLAREVAKSLGSVRGDPRAAGDLRTAGEPGAGRSFTVRNTPDGGTADGKAAMRPEGMRMWKASDDRGPAVPCLALLDRPRTRDQRALTGRQRIANLAGSFHASFAAGSGKRLLLVDDVFTTGATLCAATDALLAAGAGEVRCLTFARV